MFQKADNMPSRRESCLQSMLREKIEATINRAIAVWIARLTEVVESGFLSWINTSDEICQECKILRLQLSYLAPPILFHIIPSTIYRTFELLNELYHKCIVQVRERGLKSDFHNICLCILSSVLFPCFKEFDLLKCRSAFVVNLAFEALPMICNITSLTVHTYRRVLPPSFLRVSVLTRLEEFTYHHDCTNDDLSVVSRVCTTLKLLDIKYSRCVDDVALDKILCLQDLKSLNIKGTSISEHGYGRLLQGLPKVTNISWTFPTEGIMTLPEEDTMKITSIEVRFMRMDILCQKFRNLTRFSLLYLQRGTDTSDRYDIALLSQLDNLKIMELNNFDFIDNNLVAYFQLSGQKLVELKLEVVSHLNCAIIMRYCKKLKILSLKENNFIFNSGGYMEVYSEHFRSVETIYLSLNHGGKEFYSCLQFYTALETVHLFREGTIDNNFIHTIVNANGFQNLYVFDSKLCPIGLQAAELLITHCPVLWELRELSLWMEINLADIEVLKQRIRRENLDLTLYINERPFY